MLVCAATVLSLLLLCPTLCVCYTQVLLQSSPSKSGAIHTLAVAAGGRYDGLLRSLWSPAAASLMPPPGAVGVSINCEKLMMLLLQRRSDKLGASHGPGGFTGGLELEGGRLPAGQCDVLVCSKGGDGMLQVSVVEAAVAANAAAAGGAEESFLCGRLGCDLSDHSRMSGCLPQDVDCQPVPYCVDVPCGL